MQLYSAIVASCLCCLLDSGIRGGQESIFSESKTSKGVSQSSRYGAAEPSLGPEDVSRGRFGAPRGRRRRIRALPRLLRRETLLPENRSFSKNSLLERIDLALKLTFDMVKNSQMFMSH